ncbi:MAG: hypothetical protein ACLR5B_11485 [Blautia sp.]
MKAGVEVAAFGVRRDSKLQFFQYASGNTKCLSCEIGQPGEMMRYQRKTFWWYLATAGGAQVLHRG